MGHNRKERPRPRRSPNFFAVFKKNPAINLANDVLAPTAKEKRGQRLISFQGRCLHGHQPSEGFDVLRRSSDHVCAPEPVQVRMEPWCADCVPRRIVDSNTKESNHIPSTDCDMRGGLDRWLVRYTLADCYSNSPQAKHELHKIRELRKCAENYASNKVILSTADLVFPNASSLTEISLPTLLRSWA